jgi:hypothetical protein
MKRLLPALFALALVGACQPDQKRTDAATTPPPAQTGGEGVGWMAADGPEEAAAIFGALSQSVEMALSCEKGNPAMQVIAPRMAQLKLKVGDPAELIVSGQAFAGTTIASPGEPDAQRVTVPVTPDLTKKLAESGPVRLAANGAFIDSTADAGATLKNLGTSCERLAAAK